MTKLELNQEKEFEKIRTKINDLHNNPNDNFRKNENVQIRTASMMANYSSQITFNNNNERFIFNEKI